MDFDNMGFSVSLTEVGKFVQVKLQLTMAMLIVNASFLAT